MSLLPIGITMGDPAGIGPEIVARVLGEGSPCPCVVYGDAAALGRAARLVGASFDIAVLDTPGEGSSGSDVAHVVEAATVSADLVMGRVSAEAGAAAYAFITRAIDDALAGRLSAIVTAPINKDALRAAGVHFPGHTEILADRSGTTDFAMMLANDELRVLLVTIHLSLLDAIKAVTPVSELRAIRLAHAAMRGFGFEAPRVAVAGLNPHAGENGLFGREDLDIIAPAIAAARAEGIDASGPWPGDTIFMRARRGEFDVVVAQYHDQGLIPVKYLGIDHGVNITVGLPFCRTSVDHGTAFDIAGRGIADHASLKAALRQAMAMTIGSR